MRGSSRIRATSSCSRAKLSVESARLCWVSTDFRLRAAQSIGATEVVGRRRKLVAAAAAFEASLGGWDSAEWLPCGLFASARKHKSMATANTHAQELAVGANSLERVCSRYSNQSAGDAAATLSKRRRLATLKRAAHLHWPPRTSVYAT